MTKSSSTSIKSQRQQSYEKHTRQHHNTHTRNLSHYNHYSFPERLVAKSTMLTVYLRCFSHEHVSITRTHVLPVHRSYPSSYPSLISGQGCLEVGLFFYYTREGTKSQQTEYPVYKEPFGKGDCGIRTILKEAKRSVCNRGICHLGPFSREPGDI